MARGRGRSRRCRVVRRVPRVVVVRAPDRAWMVELVHSVVASAAVLGDESHEVGECPSALLRVVAVVAVAKVTVLLPGSAVLVVEHLGVVVRGASVGQLRWETCGKEAMSSWDGPGKACPHSRLTVGCRGRR